MEKNIQDMTYNDFLKLNHRNWDKEIVCNSIIILPAKVNPLSQLKYNVRMFLSKKFKWIKSPEVYEINGMHDSGYRCMDFVAVNEKQEPICLLSGCSDVIHIEGIGGYGYDWYNRNGKVPDTIKCTSWSIDCLPKSGLLRMFTGRKMICGGAYSSFEVYSKQ